MRGISVAGAMMLVINSVIGAGIYQLTPWKSACLRHCSCLLAS